MKLRTIAIALCLLTAPLYSHALVITVDPGPLGPAASPISIPFNDLNGTPLDGSTISLDFVFADMKYLEPLFNDPGGPIYFYNVQVLLTHDFGAFPGIPSIPTTAFLSDEDGDPLISAGPRGANQNATQISVSAGYGENVVDGLIHHDIHISGWDLPIADATITGGELQLSLSSPQGAFNIGQSSPSVPEPATLLLLSLGLAGLGYSRRRLH